jgi:drug/metabolite transporter (DMT)-like permease
MTQPRTIVFTRRRWDRLFAIATVVAGVIAGICIYLTDQFLFSLVPLAFVGMWVYFRRTTRVYGERIETIEGNPWTVRLLVLLGGTLVITLCFIAFDRLVMDHPINGPLHWYHWLFFAVTATVMTTGGHLIDRASKRARALQEIDERIETPSERE